MTNSTNDMGFQEEMMTQWFYKKKSCLCLRNDRQTEGLLEGQSVNDVDGYSPVVDWGTLRMLLMMSVQFNLIMTQVNFNQAFVQVPLQCPMYCELPPGIKDQPQFAGKILELHQSLYGHKFAAKLFYELVQDALTKKLPTNEQFNMSINDHCLFLQQDCAIVT
jgi:hypothetical protein